jgi:hypothetical protein
VRSSEQRLIEIVRSTPWLMRALEAVRTVGAPAACIGAGAVRATVWDRLHEFSTPSDLADVDVPYFDASDLSVERELAYRHHLTELEPGRAWDVVNQASVHLWYERRFGTAIAPLRSVEDGIASWPETATAVAVSLDDSDRIHVVAPFGLSDLFDCVVRRNVGRVSPRQFRTRVEAKRFAERWPKVQVVWE